LFTSEANISDSPSLPWQYYPSIPIPSPVMALAAAGGKIWAGGFGGVACYETGWRWLSADLKLASVTALCYAGGWLVAGGPDGLARSADGGSRWESADIDGATNPVASLAAAPSFNREPALLAATIGGGVLRSENAGRTWKPVNFGLQNFDVFGLAWGSDDIVLAATTDGIYRSNNGGRAWRAARGTESLGFSAVTFLPDGKALAAIDSGGLMRSMDGGASWQPYEVLAADVQVMVMTARDGGGVLLGTTRHGTLSLSEGEVETLDEAGALAFAAEGTRLAAGLPDGAGLIREGSIARLPSPPLHDLRILLISRGTPLVAGLYSGVWIWRDEAGWFPIEVPEMVTTLAEAPDGALILSGTRGLLRSVDGGSTWQSCLPGEDGLVARITFRQDGVGWAGSADGARLLHTRNNGITWESLVSPFGVMPLVALQIAPDRLFAATYNPPRQTAQLWYSLDDGQSWKRGVEARTNWPVVATSGDPALITLGSDMFLLQADGSWGSRKVGEIGRGVRRIASNDETIMALTNSDLLRSVDRGILWTLEPDLPPLDEILDIAIDNNKLFLLLTGGRVCARPL
jgi:photosystem II stability/assembly factor-like uncharacterized protein